MISHDEKLNKVMIARDEAISISDGVSDIREEPKP